MLSTDNTEAPPKNLPVNQIYFKTNSPDKIKPVLQFHASLQESNLDMSNYTYYLIQWEKISQPTVKVIITASRNNCFLLNYKPNKHIVLPLKNIFLWVLSFIQPENRWSPVLRKLSTAGRAESAPNYASG